MSVLDGSSITDLVLFWVVALIGFNHLLMRVTGIILRMWAFLPIQLLNLGTAAWLMAVGLPDFEQDETLWILNWVLGLLLIFHIIQNNIRLQTRKRAVGRPTMDQVRADRDQIAAALKRGANNHENDSLQSVDSNTDN